MMNERVKVSIYNKNTCEIKVNMSTCTFTNCRKNMCAIIRFIYGLGVRRNGR